MRVGSKIWFSDASADEIEALFRAYEDGGDRGLREWLKEFFDDKYVAGWDFAAIDD